MARKIRTPRNLRNWLHTLAAAAKAIEAEPKAAARHACTMEWIPAAGGHPLRGCLATAKHRGDRRRRCPTGGSN